MKSAGKQDAGSEDLHIHHAIYVVLARGSSNEDFPLLWDLYDDAMTGSDDTRDIALPHHQQHPIRSTHDLSVASLSKVRSIERVRHKEKTVWPPTPIFQVRCAVQH